MNWVTWFISLARTAALALDLAGKAKIGQAFSGIAAVAESGNNVEAHMAAVEAKLLSSGVDETGWDHVVAGIVAGYDRLQGG